MTISLLAATLQIVGVIILGFGLCMDAVKKYFNFELNKMPWEIRVFNYICGIRTRKDFMDLFSPNPLPSDEYFDYVKQRIIINAPIYGVVFAIIGTLLSFITNK